MAMSSVEAEYVVVAGCCAQVLWIKSQLADYDVLYDKVPIFYDNTSAIAISNNLVLHSRTKHIDIRYHFIRDHILKGDIELHFVPTDLQLADIFTKPLAEPSFTRLVAKLACQAPTDLKQKKKKKTPSSKPKSSYKVRVILPKTQVIETQPAEETVATADATKSLDASKSAEEQGKQPKTAEAEKSMPDDDLPSLSGFEIANSQDEDSQSDDTLHASVDVPAKSDPLGYLQEELCTLSTKVDNLKSTITKKVSEDIQYSVPSIKPVEEQLQMLKEQTLQTLEDQFTINGSKPMNKQLHAFNTLESRGFVTLQKELSKDMNFLLELAEVFKKANAEGEKGFSHGKYSGGVISCSRNYNCSISPLVSKLADKEKAIVLYGSELKSLEVDTSEKKDSDDEPPVKKLKFLIPPSSIPSPTPLNSILPEPIPRTEITKMLFDQFSEHLTQTTSSNYSPTPPKEPALPRDESKGKGITSEEPLKDLMPYIEEGGYVPKMPKLNTTDLKVDKEKSKESLKRIMNLENIKAQAQKIAKYEAKRANMLKEYNECINQKGRDLPINEKQL
ncbi:hypothetical protein Tco_1300957 [Tanacetum coccineum]